MKLPVCQYLSPSSTNAEIVRAYTQLHDAVRAWADGSVDLYNFDENAFDPNVFVFRSHTRDTPGVLTIPALDPEDPPNIRRKGNSTTGVDYGLEFVVDASDATYGRV